MDVSLTQQIKQVEQQLHNEAERLGQLNLQNNDFLEENQKLAVQIVELRNKIAKKKQVIEQQNKDKMIIHQKLIKAEREKQLLEIQHHRKRQLQIAREKLLQSQEQELQRISSEMKAVRVDEARPSNDLILDRIIKQTSPNQYQSNQNLEANGQPKSQQPKASVNKKPTQQKASESQTSQHYAQQTDRGEYQPPMLFQQTAHASDKSKSDDQSDEDMDEQIRAKLKAMVEDDDDEDEEDEEKA